jgi:cytochrome c-type biogenesis protein CcmH
LKIRNLADSNAELAQDLRQEVYEMIQNGATDQEIISFMVARYGDFVLYRPPFKATTAFLWVGPFIILVVGVVILLLVVRKRRQTARVELDETEQARARQLLNDNNEIDTP